MIYIALIFAQKKPLKDNSMSQTIIHAHISGWNKA